MPNIILPLQIWKNSKYWTTTSIESVTQKGKIYVKNKPFSLYEKMFEQL